MIENGMLDYSEKGDKWRCHSGFGPFDDDELCDTYYPDEDEDSDDDE